MIAGQGIDLDLSTLAHWSSRVTWWLKPLHGLLAAAILSQPKLFCDDTPNPQANTCCPALILRDGWAGVSGTAGGWTVPASDLLLAVYGTAIVFRVLLAMKRGRRRSILGPVE
jgi:hypothetical protein